MDDHVLAGLSGVQWDNLQTAHGTAAHVPVAIREILSPDAEKRRLAYWRLDNHVVLQGDLYEAAYCLIPFLISLIQADTNDGRQEIYKLLVQLAAGFAPESVCCSLPDGTRKPLRQLCQQEIWLGIDAFAADAALHPSEAIRHLAADLIEQLEATRRRTL